MKRLLNGKATEVAGPAPETFTADQVRDRLRKACEAAGGQAAWARKHDVTRAYVSAVLNGTQEPTRARFCPRW